MGRAFTWHVPFSHVTSEHIITSAMEFPEGNSQALWLLVMADKPLISSVMTLHDWMHPYGTSVAGTTVFSV